jgi:hypothetical protein
MQDANSLPLKLPWCEYPTAANTTQHGLLEIPEEIPVVNFESAYKYRSNSYQSISINDLNRSQIIKMAHMVASSFAINEPMNKHVHPPKCMPLEILNIEHKDPFGTDPFGPWTTENILYWFVRLMVLTNPSDPSGQIGLNREVFKHSLAIVENGNVIGGAFNLSLSFEEEKWRTEAPFLDAVFIYQDPIVNFFHKHEHKALLALDEKFPTFKSAHHTGKIGYIFMIARSPKLPSSHVFELFAASFEHFQKEGFEYMVITGTNNWTGAASEALGAIRVYFAPFRDKSRIAIEQAAKENEPYSNDGFISAKDSGVMIYTVKLQS